ncbi:hypothetical protein IGK16_001813 [Enterococcus pernyi]
MNNEHLLDQWLENIKNNGYQQIPGVSMPLPMIPV